MSLESIRKKINIKTFMGQSEALVENTETLKSGVKRLFTILTKKKKISPETLLEKKKTEEVKKISVEKEKEDKKKGGFDLKPLIPLLAGLGALGAITGLAILDPQMFLRRFARATLKAIGKLIKGILKTFKRIVGTIGDIFKKIFNAIADNVKKLKNLIDDKLLKPIREAFENAINSKWFKKLRSFFDDIGTSIKNFIKNSAERFKTFADDIFKKIKTFVGDFTEKAIRAFKNILDNIAEKILKPLKKAVKEFVGTTKEFLEKFVKKTSREIVEEVAEETGEKVVKRSIGKIVTDLGDSFVSNIDNVINNLAATVKKPIQTVKNLVSGIPNIGGIRDKILNTISGVLTEIDGFQKNVRSKIKSVPKAIGGIVDDLAAGKTPLNKLIDFVGYQFKPDVVLKRLEAGGNIIQSGLGEVQGRLKSAGSFLSENLQKLDVGKITNDVVQFARSIPGQILNEIKGSVINTISDPFKNVSGVDGFLDVAAKEGKRLKQAEPSIKATRDLVKKSKGAFDLFGPIKKGWREATGKFDAIFAAAEAATAYGIAVENQRRKGEGLEPISLPMIGDVYGQTIGNAILTAAGGLLGSALGSSVGAGLGGALSVATGGTAAPILIPLGGFLGTLAGGIIGEDIGKIVSSEIGKNFQIPDPLLKGKNLFSKEDYSQDITILSMFGMGGQGSNPEKETPDLAPQGGFNAGPVPRSVPINRNFNTLEEYTDDYGAEVVIINKTNVVTKTKVVEVSKSSSSNIPMLLNSENNLLNNFRQRSLSQLAYS